MLVRIKNNWFLYALIAAVLVALAVPEPGARGGVLRSELLSPAAVIGLFFIQGLILPTETLVRGLLRWRLNLWVQLYIFCVVPLLALPGLYLLGHYLAMEFVLGFFLLAVLPTTVSTAVVFTTRAEGDGGVALFNSTCSNMLAIILVPFALSLYLSQAGGDVPFLPMLLKLVSMFLLPLLVGQLLRPLISEWAVRSRRKLGNLANLLVLFVLFVAFSNSMVDGIWSQTHPGELVGLLVLTLCFLLTVIAVALLILRRAKLEYAESVAAFFSGTQKSLATGIPMAQSLLAENYAVGLVILPLMLYHFLQLTVGAVILGVLERRNREQG